MADPDPIYLDHAAATPVRPAAAAAAARAMERFGNPSSLHSFGRAARAILDESRDIAASALGCLPSEILFTSGGTESNNLALFGAALAAPPDRRRLVVTSVEHHVVLHSSRALSAAGFRVDTVPVDQYGVAALAAVAAAIRPDTALVSVMLANNETGAIQPVSEIASLCRGAGIMLHSDAIQAFCHIPISVRELGVDLLSIAAHKFGGPPGAGALFVRDGVEIRPLQYGGAQERGRRGGTENVPAIAGMAAAIRECLEEMEGEAGRIRRLTTSLREGLQSISECWFNTPETGALPGILSVGFRGVRAETMLMALDLDGVAASSGSACASGSMEPSHVMTALGLSLEEARSCLRFSLGWTSTQDDVDRALAAVRRILRLRK